MQAHELLLREAEEVSAALHALGRLRFPEQLAALEHEQSGEPVAAVQGDEA